LHFNYFICKLKQKKWSNKRIVVVEANYQLIFTFFSALGMKVNRNRKSAKLNVAP